MAMKKQSEDKKGEQNRPSISGLVESFLGDKYQEDEKPSKTQVGKKVAEESNELPKYDKFK